MTTTFRAGVLAVVGCGVTSLALAGMSPLSERKSSVETNAQGYVTRYLYQPNQEHGIFEVKQTDKAGNVTQWYQHFVDADGKVLIDTVRNPSAYGSIAWITYNVYRSDGNISEFYEFTGDGFLRKRVKYEYDDKGNWLDGVIYNAKGKAVGKELTPPESRLYGTKARK